MVTSTGIYIRRLNISFDFKMNAIGIFKRAYISTIFVSHSVVSVGGVRPNMWRIRGRMADCFGD